MLKKNNGYCLRIDPYLPIRRYDNDKKLEVPKTNILKILESLKFKKRRNTRTSLFYVCS